MIAALSFEDKQQPVVDNGLPLQDICKIFIGNINIGKYLEIGFPAGFCTRIPAGIGLFFQSTYIYALFKMQVILITIPFYFNIHIKRRILRRAKAQTVKAQRKLIISAVAGVVFSSGVHLAIKQLPVIAVFVAVEIYRNTAAKVLNLNRTILKIGDDYFVAKALPRLIYGV